MVGSGDGMGKLATGMAVLGLAGGRAVARPAGVRGTWVDGWGWPERQDGILKDGDRRPHCG